MTLVSSPATEATSRKFATSYTDAGGELYYVDWGSDTERENFLYDGWVYFASPSSDIENLEMDMNQVMSNGDTVIYGFQCDGNSGTWDYTENEGTPAAPKDHWLHSSASCNPRKWSTDTWHHVQISYSRDQSGTVTYHAVWLDGTEQDIEKTVPSAFALGWAKVMITNFQVDGVGATGSSTVYLDDLTIYRW